jgi:hypothetical protein
MDINITTLCHIAFISGVAEPDVQAAFSMDPQIAQVYLLTQIDSIKTPKNRDISRLRAISRINVWDSILSSSELENNFKSLFRISRRLFNFITLQLADDLACDKRFSFAGTGGVNSSISPEIIVGMSLRYLGGADYVSIFSMFKISSSTFYDGMIYFFTVFNERFCSEVYLSDNYDSREKLSMGFAQVSKLRLAGCIGALDGTLFEIKKPIINPSDYYSRKGKYGLNFIGIADARRKFICASLRAPGASNDSFGFKCSSLFERMENNSVNFHETEFIVVDEGLFSFPHLVIPFAGVSCRKDLNTSILDNTNYTISKMRILVECAFGLLKNRFLSLSRKITLSLPNVIHLIICAVILNNMAIDDEDLFEDGMKFDVGFKQEYRKWVQEQQIDLEEIKKEGDTFLCIQREMIRRRAIKLQVVRSEML